MSDAKSISYAYTEWKNRMREHSQSSPFGSKLKSKLKPQILDLALRGFILQADLEAKKCLSSCNVEESISDCSFISPLKAYSKQDLGVFLDPTFYSGVFYSTMIAVSKQQKLYFNLDKSPHPLNFLGCFNAGKELTIEGIVGEMVGFFMESGKITLLGKKGHASTSDYCGYGLRGGEIEIKGIAGQKVAQHQWGGVITVNQWEPNISSVGDTYGGLIKMAQHKKTDVPLREIYPPTIDTYLLKRPRFWDNSPRGT